MDISVIIPTYNRGPKILQTLEGLCRQTLSPDQFDVIVVDDGSSDDTKKHVESFLGNGNLERWNLVVCERNSGKAAALNVGVKRASSTIVLFTDDDIIPVSQWVESHLHRHENANRDVAVVGAVKYPDEWITKSNLVRFHNSQYLGQKGNRVTEKIGAGDRLPPSHFAGGNCSIRRNTLLDVGMFNENIRRGEDGELAFRLMKHGVELVFEPNAGVVHHAEVVWSYTKWLLSFQRFYRDSAPEILRSLPDEYHRWGHWFVERPDLGHESYTRTLTKLMFRGIARPAIGRAVAKILEKGDSNRMFYHPLLYQYVLTCAAIEAVNRRVD
jgi:glycosyltransferase involved in cell wall biosynthesis